MKKYVNNIRSWIYDIFDKKYMYKLFTHIYIIILHSKSKLKNMTPFYLGFFFQNFWILNHSISWFVYNIFWNILNKYINDIINKLVLY